MHVISDFFWVFLTKKVHILPFNKEHISLVSRQGNSSSHQRVYVHKVSLAFIRRWRTNLIKMQELCSLAGDWMKAKPIIVTIQFNTTNLEMEEDKGAALSIVSEVITIPCGLQLKQHDMHREAAP